MAQVSRPMLIALALTVALAAVWLVALRPKPVAVENTPLAPTEAIPAAKEGAAASDAATAKKEAAAKSAGEGTPAAPAASTPPASKATASPTASKTSAAPKTSAGSAAVRRAGTKRERVVLREISRGKVVVMLFWSAGSADDTATRAAVRALNTRNGKVKVHVIPIGRVGDYGSITRGVKIAQSPTTVIIGRKSQTRTIVGFTEPQELSQAVGDALAKR